MKKIIAYSMIALNATLWAVGFMIVYACSYGASSSPTYYFGAKGCIILAFFACIAVFSLVMVIKYNHSECFSSQRKYKYLYGSNHRFIFGSVIVLLKDGELKL